MSLDESDVDEWAWKRIAGTWGIAPGDLPGAVEYLYTVVLAALGRVELVDGSYHDVDSSEMAFKIAGSMAFKDAAKNAHPVLLEPVMRVEVVVPEEYMGDVIGDITSRRGHLQSMEMRGGSQVINARVPLSEMFGYATDLRSRTQGRGSYSMHFDRYEPAPASISQEVIAKVQGK